MSLKSKETIKGADRIGRSALSDAYRSAASGDYQEIPGNAHDETVLSEPTVFVNASERAMPLLDSDSPNKKSRRILTHVGAFTFTKNLAESLDDYLQAKMLEDQVDMKISKKLQKLFRDFNGEKFRSMEDFSGIDEKKLKLRRSLLNNRIYVTNAVERYVIETITPAVLRRSIPSQSPDDPSDDLLGFHATSGLFDPFWLAKVRFASGEDIRKIDPSSENHDPTFVAEHYENCKAKLNEASPYKRFGGVHDSIVSVADARLHESRLTTTMYDLVQAAGFHLDYGVTPDLLKFDIATLPYHHTDTGIDISSNFSRPLSFFNERINSKTLTLMSAGYRVDNKSIPRIGSMQQGMVGIDDFLDAVELNLSLSGNSLVVTGYLGTEPNDGPFGPRSRVSSPGGFNRWVPYNTQSPNLSPGHTLNPIIKTERWVHEMTSYRSIHKGLNRCPFHVLALVSSALASEFEFSNNYLASKTYLTSGLGDNNGLQLNAKKAHLMRLDEYEHLESRLSPREGTSREHTGLGQAFCGLSPEIYNNTPNLNFLNEPPDEKQFSYCLRPVVEVSESDRRAQFRSLGDENLTDNLERVFTFEKGISYDPDLPNGDLLVGFMSTHIKDIMSANSEIELQEAHQRLQSHRVPHMKNDPIIFENWTSTMNGLNTHADYNQRGNSWSRNMNTDPLSPELNPGTSVENLLAMPEHHIRSPRGVAGAIMKLFDDMSRIFYNPDVYIGNGPSPENSAVSGIENQGDRANSYFNVEGNLEHEVYKELNSISCAQLTGLTLSSKASGQLTESGRLKMKNHVLKALVNQDVAHIMKGNTFRSPIGYAPAMLNRQVAIYLSTSGKFWEGDITADDIIKTLINEQMFSRYHHHGQPFVGTVAMENHQHPDGDSGISPLEANIRALPIDFKYTQNYFFPNFSSTDERSSNRGYRPVGIQDGGTARLGGFSEPQGGHLDIYRLADYHDIKTFAQRIAGYEEVSGGSGNGLYQANVQFRFFSAEGGHVGAVGDNSHRSLGGKTPYQLIRETVDLICGMYVKDAGNDREYNHPQVLTFNRSHPHFGELNTFGDDAFEISSASRDRYMTDKPGFTRHGGFDRSIIMSYVLEVVSEFLGGMLECRTVSPIRFQSYDEFLSLQGTPGSFIGPAGPGAVRCKGELILKEYADRFPIHRFRAYDRFMYPRAVRTVETGESRLVGLLNTYPSTSVQSGDSSTQTFRTRAMSIYKYFQILASTSTVALHSPSNGSESCITNAIMRHWFMQTVSARINNLRGEGVTTVNGSIVNDEPVPTNFTGSGQLTSPDSRRRQAYINAVGGDAMNNTLENIGVSRLADLPAYVTDTMSLLAHSHRHSAKSAFEFRRFAHAHNKYAADITRKQRSQDTAVTVAANNSGLTPTQIDSVPVDFITTTGEGLKKQDALLEVIRKVYDPAYEKEAYHSDDFQESSDYPGPHGNEHLFTSYSRQWEYDLMFAFLRDFKQRFTEENTEKTYVFYGLEPGTYLRAITHLENSLTSEYFKTQDSQELDRGPSATVYNDIALDIEYHRKSCLIPEVKFNRSEGIKDILIGTHLVEGTLHRAVKRAETIYTSPTYTQILESVRFVPLAKSFATIGAITEGGGGGPDTYTLGELQRDDSLNAADIEKHRDYLRCHLDSYCLKMIIEKCTGLCFDEKFISREKTNSYNNVDGDRLDLVLDALSSGFLNQTLKNINPERIREHLMKQTGLLGNRGNTNRLDITNEFANKLKPRLTIDALRPNRFAVARPDLTEPELLLADIILSSLFVKSADYLGQDLRFENIYAVEIPTNTTALNNIDMDMASAQGLIKSGEGEPELKEEINQLIRDVSIDILSPSIIVKLVNGLVE